MSSLYKHVMIIFNYYYWLIYYLLYSFSSLPQANGKGQQLFSWCSVIAFKVWNLPNPEILGLSTLGYEHMIEFSWLFPKIKSRDNPSKMLLKSYVYRWVYFLLLILWPFIVLMYLLLFLRKIKLIWFKYMVNDIISVLDFWGNYHKNSDKIQLLNNWCSMDTYCLGRHHFMIHCYLFNYYPNLNNFKQEYRIVSKRVFAEKCRKYNIKHPFTLGIFDDNKENTNINSETRDRYAIKPVVGSWGEEFFGDGKIFFVNTRKEAIDAVNTLKNDGKDWIAQKCVKNISLINQLWGTDALGSFRMYTYLCDGNNVELQYNVLPNAFLRFPDTKIGITWEENEHLLYVNMDQDSKMKYKSARFYKSGDDMIGDNKYFGTFSYDFFMNDVCKLIKKAHKHFVPNLVLCAWDVAMTTDGPMIIEVNINNDVYLIDQLQSKNNQFARKYYQLSFQWLKHVR